MRKFEFTFKTLSNNFHDQNYTPKLKEITAYVTAPDQLGPKTGAALFVHGWDCNRHMHQELMDYATEAHDLVCVSPEFRQSGYDFNPRTGAGYCSPYDLSFFQVFDCLGALRHALDTMPLDRQRVYGHGLSQGGQIILLAAIFAPNTFAFVNPVAPLTHVTINQERCAGRDFSPSELSVRNTIEHAERLQCPVYLEHGTADSTLPHEQFAVPLERRLKELGKAHTVKYHVGGGHCLEPAITRLQAFKDTAGDKLSTMRRGGEDDFVRGAKVEIRCADKLLSIDWSQPQTSPTLFSWG